MKKNNSNNKNSFKIFIASPSDLPDERKIFREVIHELNTKSFFNEYNIEAIGWENTLIGKGRPQELINNDLEKADLVVFLLWKRWGSDSGKYSSGFEEEFNIADALDKNVWLFFKNVPNCMIEDPGPQLTKVLDFKNKIINEKKYLFNEYSTKEEWKKSLEQCLFKLFYKNNHVKQNNNLKVNKRILTNLNSNYEKNNLFNPYIASVQIALDSINRFMAKGDYTEVEAIYQNILNATSQENPLVLFHYCGFLVEHGSYNKALKYINILINWLEKYDLNNHAINLKAELYWTLGSLYNEYSSDYETSISNYMMAIKLFENNKNYESAMYCCKLVIAPLGGNNIDDLFSRRLKLLKKAYKYSKKANLHLDEVEILCALSVIYENKDKKLFNKCINKADDLIRKYKIKEKRPVEYIRKNTVLIN